MNNINIEEVLSHFGKSLKNKHTAKTEWSITSTRRKNERSRNPGNKTRWSLEVVNQKRRQK